MHPRLLHRSARGKQPKNGARMWLVAARGPDPCHIRLMEFHQNVGLIYFALMALIPFLGGALMVAVRRGGRAPATLRAAHKWVGYAAGISWLASNIASEIGSRIPRT